MRLPALVLATLLALGLAACGGDGGERSEECVDLTASGSSFTIRASALEFVPACFTASASQRLTLVNEDGARHSFTISDTPIDVDIDGGDTLDLAPITGTVEPGTYDLICKYHLPGMTGTITIVA